MMKRILAAVLCLLTLLSITACGNKKTSNPTSPKTPAATATPAPTKTPDTPDPKATEKPVEPAPDIGAPELVSVSNTYKGAQIKWKELDGAVKYRAYRRIGSEKWELIGKTTSTSITDKKAVAGTTYTYTVRAEDADGNLSSYNKDGLTWTFFPAPELVSVTKGEKGVKVVWDAVEGAVKYRVYRKTEGEKWTFMKAVKKTSFTDTSAETGKTYFYTVRALDGNGVMSGYHSTGLSIEVK